MGGLTLRSAADAVPAIPSTAALASKNFFTNTPYVRYNPEYKFNMLSRS